MLLQPLTPNPTNAIPTIRSMSPSSSFTANTIPNTTATTPMAIDTRFKVTVSPLLELTHMGEASRATLRLAGRYIKKRVAQHNSQYHADIGECVSVFVPEGFRRVHLSGRATPRVCTSPDAVPASFLIR